MLMKVDASEVRMTAQKVHHIHSSRAMTPDNTSGDSTSFQSGTENETLQRSNVQQSLISSEVI